MALNSTLRSNSAMLWHYTKPYLAVMVFATVLGAFLGLISAMIGTFIGPALQAITSPKDQWFEYSLLLGHRIGPIVSNWSGKGGLTQAELIALIPGTLISLATVKAMVSLAQWYLWEVSGEKLAVKIREDLATFFIRLSPTKRKNPSINTNEDMLGTAVTSDIRQVRDYLVHFYGGLPRELFQIISLSCTLILLSPKLTIIFFLVIAPAGVLVSRVGKTLRKRAAKALSDNSMLAEWLQQRLLGAETIKHFATESLEIKNMNALNSDLYLRFVKAAKTKARTSPILEGFAAIAIASVLVIALSDIAQGTTTGAVNLSFFATLALLSQSAAKLGRYLNSSKEGAASTSRIRACLKAFSENSQDIVQTRAHFANTPSLECKNLTVQYDSQSEPALNNFSFQFLPGNIYCLAGHSGAGKSTLFNALLGLTNPTAGKISCYLPSSEHIIGYLPQKVLLFRGTILENISYPQTQPNLEKAHKALQEVNLTPLVETLPQGLSTILGEGFQGLSGGQAQRLLLARLIYHNTPIMLIDEGTSALDPETESVIQACLRKLADSGKVIITIAHRQSVVDKADHILLLNKGTLVTSGPTQEVTQSRLYLDLFSHRDN